MSSLGDLLLAHRKSNENEKVSDSEPPKPEKGQKSDKIVNSSKSTEIQSVQKIFPERVERNDADDTKSNASSTDDYVRELLDPSDRPRNVWHLVEGPKEVPISDSIKGSKEEDVIPPPPTPPTPPNRDRHRHRDRSRDQSRDPSQERGQERSQERGQERGQERSRERSRDRSHDRSRKKHHKDRDERVRSRSRSGGRHRQSRHRDKSDDEDHRQRRGDERRSHSRSSRRYGRSRSQSPKTKRNSRTILIMQLNPRVDSHDLEDFFSDIGKVKEVRLIIDSKTRRHKGIAYIEFEDTNSANKALELNGQRFFGAPMVIQSALMDKSGDWTSSNSHSLDHQSSHHSSRSNLPPNSYRIYVGGLHVNITEEMVRSVFEPFGPIVKLELMRDRTTNISRGYAFITYASTKDGQHAVQCLDGFELAGKNLRVSKSNDKNDRQGPGDHHDGR